jgi:cation diffusion facilitator family transporter
MPKIVAQRIAFLFGTIGPTGDNLPMPDLQTERAAPNPSEFGAEAMRRDKRSVALNSVIAAVFITIFKVVVGAYTGSLGILSEAAHSGLDLIAAAVTLFSVRVSDKPADADHQFGHGKVENFSAFIETGLLLLTCVWIVYEAVERLFFHSVEIRPSIWAFVVMFTSIVIDLWRSRRLKRIADRYDSQALQADALHFSTDVWSSLAVILGLIVVTYAERAHRPNFLKADPIAALFVAAIVVWVSWRLARQTIDALLDAAPAGARARILDRVWAVDGVLEIERVRIRRAGNHYFVDLNIGLSRQVTFQRSGIVADEARKAVRQVLPEADVDVIAIPRAGRGENIFDRIRGVATRNNRYVHDISIQEIQGKLHVEQHVELNEDLTMLQAHDLVTRLEAEIRDEVSEIDTILTHIESEPARIEHTEGVEREAKLEKQLLAIASKFKEIHDMHAVMFKRVGGKLYVSCHCTFDDQMPLSRVHEIQTELEIAFKHAHPELFRVLIHPEPTTDALR